MWANFRQLSLDSFKVMPWSIGTGLAIVELGEDKTSGFTLKFGGFVGHDGLPMYNL